MQPDVLLLQDVPARETFDGFPDLPMPPMDRQIKALELLSDRAVDALTINPKGLSEVEAAAVCRRYEDRFERPVVDVFREGTGRIISIIESRLRTRAPLS